MGREGGRGVLALALALLLLVVQAGSAAAHPAHEATMREIARGLACPVCQGLSVSDSPSQLATQMRDTILQKLEAGETREQITQFFVDRYGESILFEPPKRGFGLLIWWVPVLGVLGGAVLVALTLARWSRQRGAAPEPPLAPGDLAVYQARLQAELAARREGLAP